ncbi:MAG TPA: PAS domain S-box protein, partial [Polyangiales bacterium]|nr:PAS domain S-box protein [Polyangiales bacterium]
MTEPTSKGIDGQRAEALFHAITAAAANARVGVIVTRAGTAQNEVEVIYLNRGLEVLLEAPRDEIIEKGVWSYVDPAELTRLYEMHAAPARGEALPTTFRTAMVTKTGRRVPIDVALGSVDLDGRSASVAFIIDTTSRADAEEALRRSQALLDR